MKLFKPEVWVKISLFNLLVVSAFGLLMRYKIGFEFPFFSQKNLQHAHSHFAFMGWVSQTLMVLMVVFVKPYLSASRLGMYQALLLGNLVLSYGMLIAFSIQGYAFYSITFSTLSVLLSFMFAGVYFADLNQYARNHPARLWFGAALLFNVLSAAGTFALAYMMASKQIEQHTYLASVYWYLHFQYNGWFFFACMGLWITYLKQQLPAITIPDKVFWLFFVSCIPAYGLSVLWAKLPVSVIVVVAVAAAAQMAAWVWFVVSAAKVRLLAQLRVSNSAKLLLALSAISLSIKLLLQLGSTVPAVSKLAFGFRPIVIAYLHLVLLGIITVYLLAHCTIAGYVRQTKLSTTALLIFIAGIFSTEIALAVQGIASFSYTLIPHINYILFALAGVMFMALLLLLWANNTDVVRSNR